MLWPRTTLHNGPLNSSSIVQILPFQYESSFKTLWHEYTCQIFLVNSSSLLKFKSCKHWKWVNCVFNWQIASKQKKMYYQCWYALFWTYFEPDRSRLIVFYLLMRTKLHNFRGYEIVCLRDFRMLLYCLKNLELKTEGN